MQSRPLSATSKPAKMSTTRSKKFMIFICLSMAQSSLSTSTYSAPSLFTASLLDRRLKCLSLAFCKLSILKDDETSELVNKVGLLSILRSAGLATLSMQRHSCKATLQGDVAGEARGRGREGRPQFFVFRKAKGQGRGIRKKEKRQEEPLVTRTLSFLSKSYSLTLSRACRCRR